MDDVTGAFGATAAASAVPAGWSAAEAAVEAAAVSVAPLRIARGIQNKVLEAMASGVPVVTSPQAYEGVRAEPGRDLLVGEGAAETARLVAEVVEGGHPGLGQRGRRAVEAGYAWSRTFKRLDGLLADSIA